MKQKNLETIKTYLSELSATLSELPLEAIATLYIFSAFFPVLAGTDFAIFDNTDYWSL